MPMYQTQVIFPFFTNLPRDVAVNTFHFFSGDEDLDSVADPIATALTAFYAGVYTTGAAARVNYIDWTRIQYKTFNLEDPPPRVPVIRTPTWTAATGASTIPTEVACVLSFHAAPESGVRFQRLYNRIYLPGIMPTHLSSSAVDEFPRFASTFISQITTAADGLAVPFGTPSVAWTQVSRATGAIVGRPITGGWVDNSPDTQRRRSVGASSRTTWTA